MDEVILISSDSSEDDVHKIECSASEKNVGNVVETKEKLYTSSSHKQPAHCSAKPTLEKVINSLSAKKKLEQSKTHPNQESNSADLFEKFIQSCRPHIGANNNPDQMINFLRTRYQQSSTAYKMSVEFCSILKRLLPKLDNDKAAAAVYIYIQEIATVLRQHSTKNSRRHRLPSRPDNCATTPSKKARLDSDLNTTCYDGNIKSEYRNGSGSHCATEATSSSVDERLSPPLDDAEEVKSEKLKRKVEKLEGFLKKLSDEIRRLQEQEMDLEDLDAADSVYIQECSLKKKITTVYEKLCKVQDIPMITGRATEGNVVVTATRYPEINKKIQLYINKTKKFPDFCDVMFLVNRTNEKCKLMLNKPEAQSVAESLFQEIGKILKQRRLRDYVMNLGCHLTDVDTEANDPASTSKELLEALNHNQKQWKPRLDQVINKYSQKQVELESREPPPRVSGEIPPPSSSKAEDDGGGSEPPPSESNNSTDENSVSVVDDDVIDISDDLDT